MITRVRASAACLASLVALSACGGSSARHDASSKQTGNTVSGYNGLTSGSDRDNDNDHNDDDQHVLDYGHVAGPTEARAITSLLRRYYAAAATGNGAQVCSLLAPFVAETVAEQYAQPLGVHRHTCAATMSKLFSIHHRELVGEQATLRFYRIGVEDGRSLVALDFASIPEVRQITVRKLEGRWTVLGLLDGIIE